MVSVLNTLIFRTKQKEIILLRNLKKCVINELEKYTKI